MKKLTITISREYGSGGRLIARKLAEELHIPVYDKELITEIARQTGFSENFIRDTEHKRPTNSFLYDLYCAVQTPSVSDQVFVAQSKAIREIAGKESSIFVGRCADYILRDEPNCLKVFVFAPLEERVRRAQEEYGVRETGSALTAYVNRQDKMRASYHNYFATEKWGESHAYDLCINSRLGIDTAVRLIRDAAERMMGE